jgi:hypothetical protein
MKYDFIGDVHGFASNLIKLLIKMGYIFKDDTYYHPEGRIVVFVGDYIDRGLEEEKVVNIVSSMVKAGTALASMGNHEYNAICYSTLVNGEYLRPHDDQNYNQHKAFLDEYPFSSKKHSAVIDWFKTLPLFLELDGVNVIHAAWIQKDIDFIKPLLSDGNKLNDNVLKEVAKKGDVYHAIERLLKGVELILPNNMYWSDKDGIERNTMRFNWFTYKKNVTYKNCALSIPDHVKLPDTLIPNAPLLYNGDKPVFFGHYWMQGNPKIQTNKLACLDYSVAKGGKLVAYRWNGEQDLDNKNFIY